MQTDLHHKVSRPAAVDETWWLFQLKKQEVDYFNAFLTCSEITAQSKDKEAAADIHPHPDQHSDTCKCIGSDRSFYLRSQQDLSWLTTYRCSSSKHQPPRDIFGILWLINTNSSCYFEVWNHHSSSVKIKNNSQNGKLLSCPHELFLVKPLKLTVKNMFANTNVTIKDKSNNELRHGSKTSLETCCSLLSKWIPFIFCLQIPQNNKV